MTDTTMFFNGRGCWIKKTPNKFGKWDLQFYPADRTVAAALKATGIKNKPQLNDPESKSYQHVPDDLKEKQFYILRNDQEAYEILDADGNKLDAMVGNGSEVTIQLWVQTFDSPAHGPQARSRVKAVVVNSLVEYKKPDAETTTEKTELPAE